MLHNATFTPSIQPNVYQRIIISHTIIIHSPLSILVSKPSQYSLIHTARQTTFLLHLPKFLTLPPNFQKHCLRNIHFPSRRTSHTPVHASLFKAVGTITPSYTHSIAFIPNPILHSTHFSDPHANTSH